MHIYKNSLKKYQLFKIERGNDFLYFADDSFGFNVIIFNKREGTIERKGRIFNLTKENEEILRKKEMDFLNEENKRNSSNCVNFSTYRLWYVKKSKFRYQFVCLLDDNSTFYVFEDSARSFLKFFNPQELKFSFQNAYSKESLLPLYESAVKSGDEYMVRLMNYLSGNGIKEDVDFINEYENNNILFVDKEVYGGNDIKDINNLALHRRGSMFRMRHYYTLDVKINDRYYAVSFYPGSNYLCANTLSGRLEISGDILDTIKNLAGETDNNKKTRRLLQLENFLYCYSGDSERLSSERLSRVFNDLSKVSLEDIKGLPRHWLNTLSKPQLYDWLQCAGYSGDKEANEFVEMLLKEKNN